MRFSSSFCAFCVFSLSSQSARRCRSFRLRTYLSPDIIIVFLDFSADLHELGGDQPVTKSSPAQEHTNIRAPYTLTVRLNDITSVFEQ